MVRKSWVGFGLYIVLECDRGVDESDENMSRREINGMLIVYIYSIKFFYNYQLKNMYVYMCIEKIK